LLLAIGSSSSRLWHESSADLLLLWLLVAAELLFIGGSLGSFGVSGSLNLALLSLAVGGRITSRGVGSITSLSCLNLTLNGVLSAAS
jgi:hypothetical protein